MISNDLQRLFKSQQGIQNYYSLCYSLQGQLQNQPTNCSGLTKGSLA